MNKIEFTSNYWSTAENLNKSCLKNIISNEMLDELANEINTFSFLPKLDTAYKILHLIAGNQNLKLENVQRLVRTIINARVFETEMVWETSYEDSNDIQMSDNYLDIPQIFRLECSHESEYQNSLLTKLCHRAIKKNDENLAIEFVKFIDTSKAYNLSFLSNLNLSQQFIPAALEILQTDPLVAACRNLSVNKVAELLSSGKDPNTVQEQGSAAIFYAFQPAKGFEKEANEILELFLTYPRFNKFSKDANGAGLLAHAFAANNFLAVQTLLKNGLSVDEAINFSQFPQDFCPNIFDWPKETLEEFSRLLNTGYPHATDNPEVSSYLSYLCRAWLRPSEIYAQRLTSDCALKLLEWLAKDKTFVARFPNFSTLILSHLIKTDLLLHPFVSICLERYPLLTEGQRGKLLLHHAISTGNFLLVKSLVEKKIPLSVPYGQLTLSPETAASCLTPFHHALMLHQGEIADYFLSLGIDIDLKDSKGLSTLSYFLEVPGCINTACEIISWMIERGSDIEQTNSANETLLSLLVKDETKNWPLILQLIEKEASLSRNERIQLFHNAIKSQQYALINHLVSQAEQTKDNTNLADLIESMNFETLDNLLKASHTNWAFTKISHLVRAGLNLNAVLDDQGNTVLNSAILRKQFYQAIFLVSLGADLDQPNYQAKTPAELLSDKKLEKFVRERAAAILKIDPCEQELHREFSLKNLGHLLGNAFLTDMKDSTGRLLEGGYLNESISFLQKILNFILERHSEKLSLENQQKTKKFIEQIQFTSDINFKIQSLCCNNDEFLNIALEQISKSVEERLAFLNEGESLIIPFGWSGTVAGHAMLLELIRQGNSYLAIVHNTGEGSQFHYHWYKDNQLHMDTTKFYEIPQNLVDQAFIKTLLEPELLGSTFKTKQERSYSDRDRYALLSPYAMKSEHIDNIRKAQLSGICSMSVFLALLQSKLGTINVEHLVKEIVTQLSFEDYAGTIKFDSSASKIFSEALLDVFRKYHKSIKNADGDQEILEEKDQIFEKYKELFNQSEAAFHPRCSQNPSFVYNPNLTKTDQVKNSLTTIDSTPKQTIYADQKDLSVLEVPLPSIDIPEIKTARHLLQLFEDYYINIEAYDKYYVRYWQFIGVFICKIGKALIHQYTENSELIKDLRNNPDDCLKILKFLRNLSKYYLATARENGVDTIVVYTAFAISWILGSLIEEKRNLPPEQTLRYYGIDSQIFLDKYDHEGINFLWSPQHQEDFLFLYNFFSKYQANDPKQVLFDFRKDVYIDKADARNNNIHLNPERGDWLYAHAHSQLKNPSFWNEADAEFIKQRMALPSDLTLESEEDWKINWCYLKKGLPDFFYLVRDIAFFAFIKNPKHSSRGYEIAFEGPKLIKNPEKPSKLIPCYSWEGEDYFGPFVKRFTFSKYYPESQLPRHFSQRYNCDSEKIRHYREYTVLAPQRQNTIVSQFAPKLHPLLNVRCALSNREHGIGIALTMLIDHFEANLNELKDKEAFTTLALNLTDFLSLRKAFEETPELAQELLQFLDKAIAYIQNNEALDKVTTEILYFLIGQKLRILQQIKLFGYKFLDVDNEIEKIRKNVKDMFPFDISNLDEGKKTFAQLAHYFHLGLILLESYRGTENLSSQQLEELILVRHAVDMVIRAHYKTKKSFVFPGFYNGTHQIVIQHQKEIRELLNNLHARNTILNGVLNRETGRQNSLQWEEEAFPIYRASEDKTIFQMDVLTGRVLQNKSAPVKKQLIKNVPEYERLFGKGLKLTYAGEYFDSEDLCGKIRLYPRRSAEGDPTFKKIERQMSGSWYQYIRPNSSKLPLLPKFPNANKLSVWKSLEKFPPEYIIMNNETKKTICLLDHQGLFWFPCSFGFNGFEWADLDSSEAKGITAFDLEAVLWKPNDKETAPPRLVCPSYLDEFNNEIQFEYINDEWIWKAAPHLKIAKEQKLNGIPFFNKFLILENDLGKKEALIPTIKNLCERIKLENGKPISRSPSKNLFLAYNCLQTACTPTDYETALDYLKLGFKFEGYSQKEISQLNEICTLPELKKDHSGSMYSVCLYAAWLNYDNKKRNPIISDHEEEIQISVDKLVNSYLSRKYSVPQSIRIDNVLESEEIKTWTEFQDTAHYTTYIIRPDPIDQTEKNHQVLSYHAFKCNINQPPKTPLAFYARPGKAFANQFYWLFAKAISQDIAERNKIHQLLHSMRHDTYQSNPSLRMILKAALAMHSGNQLGKRIVIETLEALAYTRDPSNHLDSQPQKLNELITLFIAEHNAKYPVAEPVIEEQGDEISFQRLTPYDRKKNLAFTPKKGSLEDIHKVYKQFFTPFEEMEEDEFDPFIYETTNEYIAKGIEALNEDYQEGVKKNQKRIVHRLKKHISLKSIKLKLNALHKKENIQLGLYRKKILNLAQKPPEDLEQRLLYESALLAKKKQPLTINDCALLFLQGDEEEFKRCTNLNSKKEIQQLYQFVGDYLLLERKVHHIHKLQKHFAKLEIAYEKNSSSHETEILIQKLGEELAVKSHYNPKQDHDAVLLMERGLNLFFKKDQIDTLRPIPEKIGKKSIIFQKIQGQGKTLIFGHILAYLKADGKHLSVHITPTAQYGTGVYDMKHYSQNLFGQKEITIVFDDHPDKFKKSYLRMIKKTCKGAIRHKKYINMTVESLESLRCKYEKTMLELANQSEQSQKLKAKAELLQQILHIFRKKAVFTIDEIHVILAALKELNMPFGRVSSIPFLQGKLIASLIKFAATAKHEGQQLLNLRENKQPQQTEEQYEKMLQIVVQRFLEDPETLEAIKIFTPRPSSENMDELFKYVLNISPNIPQFISHPMEEAIKKISNPSTASALELQEALHMKKIADFFVLANRMLGSQWLKKQLGKYVNENFGLPHDEERPPIAIPYISNMQPDEESQFCNQFVMMINTFISYAVQGLSANQTIDFIERLRTKAQLEFNQEINEEYTVQDTLTAKKFFRTCGYDLFKVDQLDESNIVKIQKSLLQNNEDGLDLLFDFVLDNVLPSIELYEHQTSCNGQNIALMPKSFIGYSASLDNLNMIPANTEVSLESGTNGQTIDLLCRNSFQVWVGDGTSSLFDEVIAKHPESKKIRAIIDVGCVFRGISNYNVAKKICLHLKASNSDIVGTLYFQEKTGKLLFINKDTPDYPIVISGTDPETIEMETGFAPDKLFTYYDQEHFTGLNILQAFDTHAILTWNENSKLSDELQGGQRLRDLAGKQRLIPFVEKGALKKIAAIVKRPEIANRDIGPADPAQFHVKDLILFGCLNQLNAQYEDENLIFCVQKLIANVQQVIHDLAYSLPIEESINLFKQTAHLFDKNTMIDLYREFAFEPAETDKITYLKNLVEVLVRPIYELLPEQTSSNLIETLASIILESSPTLKNTIPVPRDLDPVSAASRLNNQTAMTQFQHETSKKEAQKDQNLINENLAQGGGRNLINEACLGEIPFALETLQNPTFLDIYNTPLSAVDFPQIWNLNEALALQYKNEQVPPLNPHLYVTSNFAMVWENQIDLLGRFRKIPSQWLLVHNARTNSWKLLFCSVEDAINFKHMLKTQPFPQENKMFLLRANSEIKVLASNHDMDFKQLEEIPEVRNLITQALFFAGNLHQLGQKKTLAMLDKILPNREIKKAYQFFFEDKILTTEKSHYETSSISKFFRQKNAIDTKC